MIRLFIVLIFALINARPLFAAKKEIAAQGKVPKPSYFRILEASPQSIIPCLLALGWKAASDNMKDDDVWQIAVSYDQRLKFINVQNEGDRQKKPEPVQPKSNLWESHLVWLFLAPHQATASDQNYRITGYKKWHINTDQHIAEKMNQQFCTYFQSRSPKIPHLSED